MSFFYVVIHVFENIPLLDFGTLKLYIEIGIVIEGEGNLTNEENNH
ncbi:MULTISPECIES: hypothetical protein [unclassified Paenibacillus]|nr:MULTISPECIES: hypothetical protein [unclassified Paenibacillus]MBP1155306.1 hypothetical protein [Paenibacillus sp. PvP091]MBP1169310.1 hypothetical protein [Paenibacillus sp. PvR098]MBP2440338.1 hypothetical protein [Paenibacillus sp. PvP052]